MSGSKDRRSKGSKGRRDRSREGDRRRTTRGSDKGRAGERKGRSGKIDSQPQRGGKRRRDLKGAAVNLPNFVVEALERVTPAERVAGALEALGEASAAMADGRYHAAVKHARRAKELAPNDATVRETLGLAAYRIGDWQTALSELRAYRRMAGDTTHLPVEMDVLRALGRDRDVTKAWEELQRRGGRPQVMKEGAVVYASHLLDGGNARQAWEITRPGRMTDEAHEADLRKWYVAARAAARLGDADTARKIADTIVRLDPGFPGLDQLDREIAAAR